MNYKLNDKILTDLTNEHEELVALLKTLCAIPAPLNQELARAEFCKKWLEEQGATGVYIDEAYNAIFPLNCTADNKVHIFSAHTDTVFPDTEPMALTEKDGIMSCPGVGDDTANLALLLMTAKYILKHGYTPDEGCVFVCNSGEEGFGNLKGAKAFMQAFAGRVISMTSFDGPIDYCVNYAVGSTRYKITIKTEGGHSFAAFGNRNAIAYMSSLIDTLYKMKVPAEGTTTYNVGTIAGGTSINTICQEAVMTFEYRSDIRENLNAMMEFFDATIAAYQKMGITVEVEVLGQRPCMGDVDPASQKALEDKMAALGKLYYGEAPAFHSGSTDCNIPFSMGVPACAMGGYVGDGAHTREEWLKTDSLKQGYPLVMAAVLDVFRKNNPDLFVKE